MNHPIAILGAGPCGLTLARLLSMKNIDYIVFERDDSPDHVVGRGLGGTLDIHTGSGQLALQECGLFDEFKSLARYDGQAFKVIDSEANVLCDMKDEGQEDRPEVDRKDLRRLLLDSVPAEKIRWDKKVRTVEREENGSIVVHFVDGGVERGFKLVVGADGAWSKARNLLTSAKPYHYSGITYLQTSISTSNTYYSEASSRIGRGSYMALSPDGGKAFIAQRLADGSYMAYIGLELPENWSKASVEAKTNAEAMRSSQFREKLLEDQFAGWTTDITDLIKHSDEAPYNVWQLNTLPSDAFPWKSQPGVTLIGDAAHVSLPNGEGVNCAMFDSLQLVQEIEKCGLDNMDQAVGKYEEKMFPRAVDHIEDGWRMTKMFFSPGAPNEFNKWLASIGAASGDPGVEKYDK